MKFSRSTWWLMTAWIVVVVGYALVSALSQRGPALTAFGDIVQCLAPLFASTCLLLNAGSADWRKNIFWTLLATGCTLWMIGQLVWTYFEGVMHYPVPSPFFGDVIMFLHVVPMMAALALEPHTQAAEPNFRLAYLDFTLLLLWWVYLYVFAVTPWQYVVLNTQAYGQRYNELYALENAIFVAGVMALAVTARGYWRAVYAHLFGAAALFAFSAEMIDLALDTDKYYTGCLYDVPLVASFIWFGAAGIKAFRERATASAASSIRREQLWPGRLAICAILSMPLLAGWSSILSRAPFSVQQYRLSVTLVAILLGTSLVFVRRRIVDRERSSLLRQLHESFRDMQRLQVQFVQAEKFASLGQLASHAAHEINNPLTAILGYSELLADDKAASEKSRTLAAKIGEQVRRTKGVVSNLISMARQAPCEKTSVSVNALLSSVVQLRTVSPDSRDVRIELQTERGLPGVRADSDQLLHVFYTLINDAAGGLAPPARSLAIRSFGEKGNVVIEMGETTSGREESCNSWYPLYLSDLVQPDDDSGLSICYGIVKDHGGQIFCSGRPEGGVTFRIELPALPEPAPFSKPAPAMKSEYR